jgi:hypothetical protein
VALYHDAVAQEKHQVAAKHGEGLALHRPNEIKWQDGPATLPPGAKFALLEGDPSREGPFTMPIRMPDGHKIPPHTHPATEHVTVISGTFNFGMGEKSNISVRPMTRVRGSNQ